MKQTPKKRVRFRNSFHSIPPGTNGIFSFATEENGKVIYHIELDDKVSVVELSEPVALDVLMFWDAK